MKKQAYNKKFDIVMTEYQRGTLKSSSGKPVTSKAQAVAIAISEAKKHSGKK